uniref:DNA-directed RNA polymerase I subunit RPA12-like n=1 Tax=Rhizophora mucronata TaxID=61149 RepID=A0A2P2JT11_RHIMU
MPASRASVKNSLTLIGRSHLSSIERKLCVTASFAFLIDLHVLHLNISVKMRYAQVPSHILHQRVFVTSSSSQAITILK